MNKKLILILVALIVTISGIAQTAESISPDVTTEFCPNTDVTFTVSVPGTNPSVASWTNGPIVVQGVYNSVTSGGTTTFNFKGRFQDKNVKQVFKIGYTSPSSGAVSKEFEFKKIKSLYFDNTSTINSCFPIQPNTLSVNPPLCQIINIPISFENIKWNTFGENPAYCFGTITTYEYLLPAGWSIGSYVSTGSNWIPGGKSVTITTDASTGDNSNIQIRAANSCASGLFNGQTPAYIHITRPTPTFTISPSSLEIKCTNAATQTFTVNATGTINCPITYKWELGNDNHWRIGNDPAQATFTTSTNSITLTSASSTILPSSVKVTPLLNGVDQPQLTAEVSWSQPSYGILGGSNICTGTSQPFYVYNTTAGSSYAWGSVTTQPNYGATVVQINSPYSNQTTLTKLGDGVVTLSVHVTNACQQVKDVTRTVSVGGYSQSSGTLSGYMLAYPPCNTPLCTPSPVSSYITTGGPYGTIAYGGASYLRCQNDLQLYNTELEGGTWSLLSGSVVTWWSNIGTHLSFYPGGPSGDLIKFRLTKNNSCGNQYYDFYFTPTLYNYSSYSIYTISPNPASSIVSVRVDEAKLSQEKITKSNSQDIKEISIVDKMGAVISKQAFGKNIRMVNLNVSNLKPDIYIIRIFNGKDYTSLKFIKE